VQEPELLVRRVPQHGTRGGDLQLELRRRHPNGSGVTPTHGYAAAGTYSVTLDVTGANGTSSKTTPVTVTTAPPPPAGPVANTATAAPG
jgi:hypothetical protein